MMFSQLIQILTSQSPIIAKHHVDAGRHQRNSVNMARSTRHKRTVLLFVIMLLLAASLNVLTVSTASARPIVERSEIHQIVVRYKPGAPASTPRGAPWGSQCVADSLADLLKPGRSIGGRMRVIRLRPPQQPMVAQRIARQLEKCPFIEWAEADDVVYVTSIRVRS
jgi:hypothetical protein